MFSSNLIFLNAMMAAAKWLSARKLRSSFSYLTSSLRKRLNQLCAQLRNIMPVSSGHDDRQRDATTVHQQMALAPIFFPDPLDWVQRFPEPAVPSSSPRQYSAIARQYPQARRTRQAPTSTMLQRPPLSPTPEIGHESHR